MSKLSGDEQEDELRSNFSSTNAREHSGVEYQIDLSHVDVLACSQRQSYGAGSLERSVNLSVSLAVKHSCITCSTK